jgi:hypothetical protein
MPNPGQIHQPRRKGQVMQPIDKGIPFPGAPIRHAKYPWQEMQVGDSFVHTESLRRARSAANNAGKQKKNQGKLFRAAMHDGAVRIWRME